KAAGAVSAVSGEQIIKAIVDAAGKGEQGKKASEATNPIEAAIGTADDDEAAAFGKEMKKDASKAAGAVSAVSGEQIIKAIVDA
uniref:variable large family protein n=1 Tax=Borreliella afzelii TaxID=29518 RepID=UPI00359C9CE4